MSRRPTPPLTSDQPFTAVIGDMLASKTLPRRQRLRVQEDFNTLVAVLNDRYRRALLSQWAITLGDEFQCVLADPTVLPDVIWDISTAAHLPRFRLGIGFGRIDTIIPPRAINLDGPALHHARTAIETARRGKILGGVFFGFGEKNDVIANALARLLHFHRSRRSPAQLSVLALLRQGHSQVEIARILKRTPQAIHAHKSAAGWDAYHAGEQALRRLFEPNQESLAP